MKTSRKRLAVIIALAVLVIGSSAVWAEPMLDNLYETLYGAEQGPLLVKTNART